MIERIDKYTIVVDEVRVYANSEQEERIRAMTPEQRKNFVAVFGAKS